MTSRRYELTEEQWDKIKQYFEAPKKNGRPYKNVHNTVNGSGIFLLKAQTLSANRYSLRQARCKISCLYTCCCILI